MNRPHPEAPERLDIVVSYRCGAYVTRTVRGQRASCTASAEDAAHLLARKLAGLAGEIVSLRRKAWPLPGQQAFELLLRRGADAPA